MGWGGADASHAQQSSYSRPSFHSRAWSERRESAGQQPGKADKARPARVRQGCDGDCPHRSDAGGVADAARECLHNATAHERLRHRLNVPQLAGLLVWIHAAERRDGLCQHVDHRQRQQEALDGGAGSSAGRGGHEQSHRGSGRGQARRSVCVGSGRGQARRSVCVGCSRPVGGCAAGGWAHGPRGRSGTHGCYDGRRASSEWRASVSRGMGSVGGMGGVGGSSVRADHARAAGSGACGRGRGGRRAVYLPRASGPRSWLGCSGGGGGWRAAHRQAGARRQLSGSGCDHRGRTPLPRGGWHRRSGGHAGGRLPRWPPTSWQCTVVAWVGAWRLRQGASTPAACAPRRWRAATRSEAARSGPYDRSAI